MGFLTSRDPVKGLIDMGCTAFLVGFAIGAALALIVWEILKWLGFVPPSA